MDYHIVQKACFSVLCILTVIACHRVEPAANRETDSTGELAAASDKSSYAPNESAHTGESSNLLDGPSVAPREDSGVLAPVKSSNRSSGAVEATLLRGSAINAAVQEMLGSAQFNKTMSAFENESLASPSARKRTEAYASLVNMTLAEIPGSTKPSRFACGENACLGTIRGEGNDEWFKSWYMNFAREQTMPVPALTAARVQLPGNFFEYRVLFTTHGTGEIYQNPPKQSKANQ